MWWSVAQEGRADSKAAQLFHRDFDRLRFLKFFFYLTDVTEETGPHAFIDRSHRVMPSETLRLRRYTDEEVLAAYPRGSMSIIKGDAGTIFMADTVGMHKGQALESGWRLIFQVEFSSSLFGGPYQRHPPELLAESVRAKMETEPQRWNRFL